MAGEPETLKGLKMERHDYRTEMENDIAEFIKYNLDYYVDFNEIEDADEIPEQYDADALFDLLYDEMFISDSITGNASGSYYCNAWKAEEAIAHNLDLLAIAHNLDLLAEAGQEFCCEIDILSKGAEACDVTIRCYLLGAILREYLEENEDEIVELLTAEYNRVNA